MVILQPAAVAGLFVFCFVVVSFFQTNTHQKQYGRSSVIFDWEASSTVGEVFHFLLISVLFISLLPLLSFLFPYVNTFYFTAYIIYDP